MERDCINLYTYFWAKVSCICRLPLYFLQFLEQEFQDKGNWLSTAYISSTGKIWLWSKPVKAYSGVLPFSLLTAQTVFTEILAVIIQFQIHIFLSREIVFQRRISYLPVQELIARFCHLFCTFTFLLILHLHKKKMLGQTASCLFA